MSSENLFLIPLWERPEITRICLNNIKRFGHGILCIVSTHEDANLCNELGVNYLWHENQPLGKKWNYGLFMSQKMEWDYLITLGSDDIVKESLFDWYAKSNQDVMIMDKIHFIDVNDGRANIVTRARIGAGRRISRRAIDRCNYKLWTDGRNKSLDMDSNGALNRAGFATVESNTNPHILGLKSDTNIWGFNHVAKHGAYIVQEKAFDGVLPETKKEILHLLEKKNKLVAH